MTPSDSPGPPPQDLLEQVLAEYMLRLDRGETVDREQLLAQHPELAEVLLSYFAGSDELTRLGRPPGGEARTSPPLPTPREPGRPEQPPPPTGATPSVGDYELLELIGQGGMGVIYKARQRSLGRLVALKMIRTDRLTSPTDVARFRSEAEAVASLDHPHIVPIYEVGEHQGQHYFSMRLVEGGGLERHLPRLASDVHAGASLLATVARAVHYAHQRGILHRDLKPANILLDAQGQPHVTDFGLAKRLPTPGGTSTPVSLTQQGMIVGTPSYMAPEQAAAQGGVSTAADVYSLGAILYELLTGRPPFGAPTPLDTLLQVLEQEPAAPRRLNRRVDRDLETVCLKCLHKDPQRRYASALHLAEDLERWHRGEPIQARPISRRERLRKWVRRQPHLAALVAGLVLVLLAGFAGVTWQWRRAEGESRKATDLAETERRTAYARAIPLAHAEWRAGDAGPAEEVLNACPPERRGWEWRYLRRLFQGHQLATWDGQAGAVRAVALSPDGTRVAVAGSAGLVKVWDRHTLQPLLTLRGDGAEVTAVTFSPDGRRLASGSAEGGLRVWDATGGQQVAAWRGPAARVTDLAFDPTGQRLASTGGEPSNGDLHLWDPNTGVALAGRTWRNLLAAVAFSPDGKYLATAGPDGSVALWDAARLQRPLGTFKGQTERIVLWTSVAFSGDGRWVAAGSSDGVVRVWDATTAQELFSALTPTQAGVSRIAFCGRDGRILVAATADNTLQGWFTRSGKPAFTLRGHKRAVTAVACSPDGGVPAPQVVLASGSLDGTVKLWDVRRREEDLTLRPANEGVTAIAFSADGTLLAAATRDRALKVWDVASAKAVVTVRDLPEAVRGLAFHPDGTQLVSAGEDGAVHVWEIPGGREKERLDGQAGPVHAVAFSPDGAQFAAAGADGTVRVREVAAGRESRCLDGQAGPVHAVAFSPDGRWLAGGGDGVVRVWETATGHERLAVAAPGGPVYAVAFSRDGRQLAASGQDETIRVWDTAGGALALTLRGHAGAVRGLAYGLEGRLASAGDDRAVRLWDAAGRELLALRGHTEALRALAFSPDGHRLASASDDGTIKVWDGTPLEGASAGAK